jgi:hypothetical protein
MKRGQYITLMHCLDAALNNGFGDELKSQTSKEIIDEIREQTGLPFDAVPLSEIDEAITKWKERNNLA